MATRTGFVHRLAPVVGLFFLSPLIAEFLLGNLAVDQLAAVLFLAPLYGGGALLVRELARRAGRGWPTMIVLALAYAVVEEGLVTQTLFNPSYLGLDLLSATAIPALGIGAWWTLFVLTLHVVWSISVSIALVEALTPTRATSPWLGGPGFAVTTLLFVLGCVSNFAGTYASERFLAAPTQLAGAALVVLVVVWAAFRVGGERPAPTAGVAPDPWLVGGAGLLVSSAFMAAYLVLAHDWFLVAGYLVLYALTIAMVTHWSRRAGWGPPHRLALAGGALLTYAWYGFPSQPVLGSTGTIDLVGNTIFAVAALLLLVVAGLRTRRAAPGLLPAAAPHPAGE